MNRKKKLRVLDELIKKLFSNKKYQLIIISKKILNLLKKHIDKCFEQQNGNKPTFIHVTPTLAQDYNKGIT